MSSIRGRVLLLAMLAQLLATSCAVGLAIWYVDRALWTSVDSELQARAVSLLALVGQADDNPYALDFDSNQVNVPQGDLFYIVDPRGRTVAGSSSWITEQNRPEAHARVWLFKLNGIKYRGKALIETPILDQEDMKVPQLHVNLYYAMPVARTESRIAEAARKAVHGGALVSAGLSVAHMVGGGQGHGSADRTRFARRQDSGGTRGIRSAAGHTALC